MAEKQTKYCSNCCQNIEYSKFFLHERMCSINVKKCPKCQKPIIVEDLEEHMEEAHGEEECEFCKKKYPKMEIEKHKNRCDCKMIKCIYCDLEVLLGEIKEHQINCGAITEPCPNCGRYIQKKDLDNHLIQGCPPPKNERRSVDVRRNSNNKLLFDMNNNNNIMFNYYPVNNFVPEDILKENVKGKVEIKMHNNMSKPNLQMRPSSGKKVLNENMKKNMSNFGSNNTAKNNFEQKDLNNIINNDSSTGKDNKNSIKMNSNNYKRDNNYYFNKQNSNQGPISIKPTSNNNNNQKDQKNSRYNNNTNKNNNIGKINSKPSFATNLSKGNLNAKSSRDGFKKSDEEFRKTKEKLNFKEGKEIQNVKLNKTEVIPINSVKKKGIINDEDFIANFNFGEVDDDQLLQQVIEQSLKDQNKKK